MRHITLIRIKNEDFDYTKYGLENNYFTIDISQTLNYTKNVGFTQYALLDGTTRVDNISREPGSVSFQGVLGEIRAGGKDENFVKSTLSKTRLQNQMDLLEALRDEAIFLDFITDERTYRDFMISGVSFGKTKLDEITVSLSTREVLTFGDTIDVINTNKTYEMSPYERSVLLDNFYMYNIESDIDLVNELNRIINTSNLTTPFIIKLGSVDINSDVIFPSYAYKKPSIVPNITIPGRSEIRDDANKLTKKANANELISGPTVDGFYLHVSSPMVNYNTNLYRMKYTLNPSGIFSSIPLSKTNLNIRLKQGENTVYSTIKGEILKEPRFSDIVNGVHFLNTAGSTNDIIASHEYSIPFIRKQKDGSYSRLPNLLGSDSRGYLYSATYELPRGSQFELYPVIIYIHYNAWIRIKSELSRVWNESKYFRNKRLVL